VDVSPSQSDFDALQKPLEHFRAKTRRLKIHPLETALLWLVGGQLVFQPWALGGMRPWAQWIGLVWSVFCFASALVPRDYTEEHTGSNRFRLVMWPRLVRFPIFWLGLALLGLVTVQALNPAWTYESDGKGWWMRAIDHVSWLPSGVRVPFERWGPWRMLLIYSTVWLTVCAVWTGFTRRRSVQALFVLVSVNGLVLAAFGVAERVLSNGKMFWIWNSPNPAFFSTFVYKNHAAAYLILTLAVSCGLAAWYYLRGLRRLEKSNPSGVFAFFGTCIAVSILVSYARGATLIMLVFLCATIGFFVVHQLLSPSENRKPIVALVLILIFGYFLKTGLQAVNSREAWTKLRKGIEREDNSLASRELATKASAKMLGVYWVKGAGAGAFPFLFPVYQSRYADLVAYGGQRMFWNHAHNDVLEIPIDLGLGGMILILAAISYLGFTLLRGYFWQKSPRRTSEFRVASPTREKTRSPPPRMPRHPRHGRPD
jgi:hypothetical protein